MNNPAAISPPSHIDSLAYAYGVPTVCATLRCHIEDFCVQEQLSFEPSGNGNHTFLYIQKRRLTTEELAKRIAKFADVSPRQIGYAGLKDRNAVTSQWFSVDLSGKPEPHWHQLESEQVTLLNISRHERKLKQGAVKSNGFTLLLRNLQGEFGPLEAKLSLIADHGVPNYFGEQRFGIEENNLRAAYKMFAGEQKVKNRYLRGMYYSAARSYLFNLLLSYRVTRKTWDQAIPGDAMILNGSRSFFVAEEIDENILQRLARGDIHPSGPLWGKGPLATQGEAQLLELQALQDFSVWQKGLEHYGLEQQRRALRLLVGNLQWEWQDGDVLQLTFTLPSGAYATSVVRELALG